MRRRMNFLTLVAGFLLSQVLSHDGGAHTRAGSCDRVLGEIEKETY